MSFWVAKGGTGKTTTAGHVGHAMARAGRRVLMIDADPQGNLSSWYLTHARRYEFADVLYGDCAPLNPVVGVRDNLDLIPTFGLGGRLAEWSDTKAPGEPFAIADMVDALKTAGLYDAIIFDMGPGTSTFGKVVNAAVDIIVPVVLPEYFSIDGLEIFREYVSELRQKRRSDATTGPTVVNRADGRQSTHNAYRLLGAAVIGQSTDISDCIVQHETVFEYSPRNRYISEYERLADLLWRH
jgi:chromosome partitioning protein